MKRKDNLKNIFANVKIAKFINKIDNFFIKLPHFPKKIRIIFNKSVVFIAALLLLIGILSIISSVLSIYVDWIYNDYTSIISSLIKLFFILINTTLLAKSIKPLNKNDAVGWIYLFWTIVIDSIHLTYIAISVGEVNLSTSLIAIFLSFYLLFEIGEFYTYKNIDQN